MRLVAAIVLALGVVAGPASAAGPLTSTFFKTPDNAIWCSGGKTFVVCGIKGGFLKPKPKNNCRKEHIDYVGNRLGMTNKSKGQVQPCAGDAGPFAEPKRTKVLAYGKNWKVGGLKCTAQTQAMTCQNTFGHGFFISKTQKYKLF